MDIPKPLKTLIGPNLGLIAGAVGAIVFMALYYSINLAFIHFYGAASCSISSRVGILITAPINYCEDYAAQNIGSGIIANMGVPALVILITIMYSVGYERQFRRYLSFRNTLIVAIVSTYALSVLNLAFAGKPAAGTSIIGFDLLLFLFMGFLADYVYFERNSRASPLTIRKKPEVRRVHFLIGFTYLWGMAMSALCIIMFYLTVQGFALHLASGFILLLYLFIAKREILFPTALPRT